MVNIKITVGKRSIWRKYFDVLAQYVKQEFRALQETGIQYFVHANDKTINVQCFHYSDDLTEEEVFETFRHFVSTAVSEFFIDEMEKHILSELLKHDYKYHQPEECEKILRFCHYVLTMDDDAYSVPLVTKDELKIIERKCHVFKRVYHYLKSHRDIHLEGFWRFRLKDYRKQLTDAIEYAIEEYILDQEYQEFISLLRYFISMQDPKVSMVHVVQLDYQQFQLYSEAGELLSKEDITFYLKDWIGDVQQYDELIISTLISMAPQNIILHTSDTQTTVIQTLMNIFEERLVLCTHCQQCSMWKANVEKTPEKLR